MKAMILAAGRGERLRPFTDTQPKPLIQVGERALIEYHLLKLAAQKVKKVVINHAWLGEQIEAKLGNGEAYGVEIDYSPEPSGGLETAGGIMHALPKFGLPPFWVVNADILCDYDYISLPRALPGHVLAHLVLVPTPDYKTVGDFGLDENRQVTPYGDWTFSGISMLSPRLFEGLPPGRYPLAPILRQAMTQGAVTGEIYRGYWSDIGTPERLEQARARIKNQADAVI